MKNLPAVYLRASNFLRKLSVPPSLYSDFQIKKTGLFKSSSQFLLLLKENNRSALLYSLLIYFIRAGTFVPLFSIFQHLKSWKTPFNIKHADSGIFNICGKREDADKESGKAKPKDFFFVKIRKQQNEKLRD